MRLLYIALLLSALSFGQDRNGISYQALILNPQGEQLPGANNNTVPMANTEVCLRFHITTNAGSYNEYSERQVLTTDAYGMINTVVGTGAPVGTIMWNQIVWTEDSKGLKVEIDYSGECSSFVALSSQELTSVPFALYSPASNIPGPPGEPGDSAYQLWLDAGNTGTEQEFLDSLKGTDGEPGEPGADGDSAYQVWIDEGNTGTEQEFLDSLKGTDGEPGEPGADGLLDSGDNTGDIVYWNGSQWTILPIGSEGDVLTVINGVPSWGQQATDEPPIITLIGDNPLNLNVGDEYIELGATAYDQVDGDITSNIVSDSSLVNTSLSGSYNVTYNVTDSSGNKTTKVREVNVINPSGLIYIPDDAFEQHLIDLNLDDVMDDYVLKSNVVDLKYLFFSPGFNLIGIEHFLSLESVNFNVSNTIETIDLSNLTSLKEITVHSNAVLSQLILPNINSSVERILIHSNGYASTPAFNVEFLISGLSNQSGLKYLGLWDTEENIESLDLSNLTQLDDIWLSSSVLTSLDLSNNVNLKSIILSLNSANSLDFSNNINLKELSISGSSLTSINMTKNNLLEDLIITGTLINNLDLSQCSSLINVDIENNNQLVNINLANSNNQSINIFDASSNSSLNCIQIDENFSPPSPVFNNTHLSNSPPHYWYFYINYYSSAGEPMPNNSNSNNFGGNPMWSISPPESWTQQNIQDAGYDPSYSQQACGDGSGNTAYQIGDLVDCGVVFYIAPVPTDLDGDGDLDNGLICGLKDVADVNSGEFSINAGANWSTYSFRNIELYNTESSIGSGNSNTNLLIETFGDCDCPTNVDELITLRQENKLYAAKVATCYNPCGNGGWFLPSYEEYYEMFKNRQIINQTITQNGGTPLGWNWQMFWGSPQKYGPNENTSYLTSTECDYYYASSIYLPTGEGGCDGDSITPGRGGGAVAKWYGTTDANGVPNYDGSVGGFIRAAKTF